MPSAKAEGEGQCRRLQAVVNSLSDKLGCRSPYRCAQTRGSEWGGRCGRGIKCEQKDDCFTYLADLGSAQVLRKQWVELPWAQLHSRWAQAVDP